MDFRRIFDNSPLPVVIIHSVDYSLYYANKKALDLFGIPGDFEAFEQGRLSIYNYIQNKDRMTIDLFLHTVKNHVADFENYFVFNILGKEVELNVKANIVEAEGTQYIVSYLSELHEMQALKEKLLNQDRFHKFLTEVLQVSLRNSEFDHTLNLILKKVGNFVNVSRVYIFEIQKDRIWMDNTYEWCKEGIEPEIKKLQNLNYQDIPWRQALENDGMIICKDIDDLDEMDAAALRMQGIKSIAVFPFYKNDQVYGFIGYDECDLYRDWTQEEVVLLQNIAGVISSILLRRDEHNFANSTIDIMQTVLDNLETAIYVSSLEDYQILFANKKIKQMYGVSQLENKSCYKALQNSEKTCPFCPVQELFDEDGNPVPGRVLHKEFYNAHLNRWFIIYDMLVKWIDGRYAHMEQAIDITDRKKNEQLLEFYAKTDVMTGAYKREWGLASLEKSLHDRRQINVCLTVCFMDIDGLKDINDTFGHTCGDTAIKIIVNTIKNSIRSTDLLCRLGGDEFLVVMHNCTEENARHIFKQVDTALRHINESGKYKFAISISKGFLEVGKDNQMAIDEVMRLVDEEMYKEKNKKKQGLCRLSQNIGKTDVD